MIYIVMPAYNAARTIKATIEDIPNRERYNFLVCDDGSKDNTVEAARALGLEVIEHAKNRGYGANQKTLYNTALQRMANADRARTSAAGATRNSGSTVETEPPSFASLQSASRLGFKQEPEPEPPSFAPPSGARKRVEVRAHDIIVMFHPDNQYDGRAVPKMIELIKTGAADFVLGNRMSGRLPNLAGMPWWKQLANRMLTSLQKRVFGVKLGEFHSGLRAYTRQVLQEVSFRSFSDDFVFDSEMIAAAVARGFRFAEIPVQAKYFREASSINFARSVKYGLETLKVLWRFKKGYYN